MPTLPIPMIIALVLAALLVQRLLSRGTQHSLLALIAVCAAQSAVIALVQHYEVSGLRPVQPVLAMVIPPVAWFAFAQASGFANERSLWLFHGIGPVLAGLCLGLAPQLLDALIPASFLLYGGLMLGVLWRGEDSLPNSLLASGSLPVIAWRVVALSLIASAACDVLIAYGAATGQVTQVLWVPSVVSSLTLLSLGYLSLTHAVESARDGDAAPLSAEDALKDQQIVEQVEHFLAEHKSYLDPDLTLTRLSRKVVVPAKPLSAAINRVKGENVSRFINRYRVEHAAALLEQGGSVTSVIYESGFNTKSNFNREFLRVKGVSPRDWQARAPQ